MSKRSRNNWEEPEGEEAAPAVHCWLCERPLGEAVDWHHPVPKSKGGKAKVAVHPICASTIAANFTNAELARKGEDLDFLRSAPAMIKFLEWVADKPADFYVRTTKPGRK